METEGAASDRNEARAVVEALRAGIASTAVSEIFASGQNRIVDAFGKLLDAHHGALAVEGGYGQGKTHLLKHLAQLARRRGYVVSLVPLSKETPFNHWWHVYAAAVRHARVPDGRPVEAVLRRHRWEDPALQELHAFAADNLHARLAALLAAAYRTDDTEAQFALFTDLLGKPLANGVIARAYRQATNERVKLPAARLQQTGRDYFALMARLFQLSEYAGWVLLFDEFELVCKLGRQARGRAYANLRAFTRSRPSPGFDQLVTVVTLIDQMTSDYLVGGKRDIEQVPVYFRQKELAEVAADAEKAMRWLAEKKLPLRTPTAAQADAILDRIADLHQVAYDWRRPEGRFYVPELSAAERMRTRVRFCVESLDLARLYGEAPEIETHAALPDTLHEDEALFSTTGDVEVIEVDR